VEPRLNRLSAVAAVALAALTLAAACGGGRGGGGGGGDERGDDVVPTAPAGDQAVAERANLVIGDFPPEWRATPVAAATSAQTLANERAFAQCMGRPPPDEDRTAVAYSADFNSAETRRVASSAQTARTVEVARADFEAQRGDRALACHKAQIDSEFRRQLPGSNPQTTVERLEVPVFGEETVGFRVDVTSVAQGGQVRTVIDLVFMRKGRAEVAVNFIERNAPFPQDLQRSLLLRAISRA